MADPVFWEPRSEGCGTPAGAFGGGCSPPDGCLGCDLADGGLEGVPWCELADGDLGGVPW